MIKQALSRSYIVFLDIIGLNTTFLFVMLLHYEGSIPSDTLFRFFQLTIFLTIGKLLIYRGFQLYNSVWEYASIEELIKVVMAVSVANILTVIYLVSMNLNIYFGIYLMSYLIEILAIGGIRFGYRFIRRIRYNQSVLVQEERKTVLIIGSGSTASLIATEIKNHPESYGKIIGFIDDDPTKLNKTIAGVKVLGNKYDIYSIVNRKKINEIIIAIPTATSKETKEILAECKRCDVKVRILPGVREIIDGQVSLKKIRDVEIEDLLGREPVNLNVIEIAGYIEDKIVLVTGGGGSIGSELCRQIARFNPKKLIILDIYENNAYEIQNELHKEYPQLILDVIIASVRERDSIFSIIEENKPNVIFHAAAHKHVPLMERVPKEAIKNNVFGTLNVAEAAHALQVERFVLISTDKAVNPTNIMGASKRICELIIQGLSKQSTTKFVVVRFGNVLGSNGSVIPLFKRQIKDGGPVTVTHKEIIRYFMTIPEASQLVIQAGAIAKGGEIFVLDMGEPVKIYDLALDLIRLSGFKPFEDIDVEVTGLRAGEKLYEELLTDEEHLEKTKYNKIYIGQPGEIDFKVLKNTFKQLNTIIQKGSNDELIDFVRLMIPSYQENHVVNSNANYTRQGIELYENKI